MPHGNRALGVVMAVVLVSDAAVATAGAAQKSTSFEPGERRSARDPATGAVVTVSNEGDCRRMAVDVDIPAHASGRVPGMEPDLARSKAVTATYSISPDRTLVEIQTSVVDISSLVDEVAVESMSWEGRRDPRSDRTSGLAAAIWDGIGRTVGSCGTIYGNYIHTSSTLQDIVNIDIANLRYHTDRKWDNCNTSFKSDRWGTAYVSVRWNHIGGAGESWAQRGWRSRRTAKAYGKFHSDFLWCNMQSGQNFYLYNYNKTYAGGAYGATFRQSRTCSGTHMATAKWTSTSRYG